MEALRSLTREEARERAATIAVDRYDIEVDLTGLLEGDALRCVSAMRFTASAGASTFVDCAAEVVSATLNGRRLAEDVLGEARILLDGLEADNTLVVETVQHSTEQGTGVHRTVDATDGAVYVWTSFEPDEARRAWACFDQPDLKAPVAFTVTAPATWLVVSNSDTPEPEDLGDKRRWSFADTPPLSTYVPVINAGPLYELRSERDGFDLGLLTRQSLAGFLDRDAEELFGLTAAGLAFFGERFDMAFPQRSYDQVFMPDMGGAMENYGCVTYSDSFIYRRTPSPQERGSRAEVLLHEMAHMWFGDIVTMRWWDDLWLNEAFAEWACYWASEAATEFTDAWAGFLADAKVVAYPVDRGPTSHPIRQPAPDVAVATAGFDVITYIKGASVLKQLVAYVGEDNFVAGLRSYFARYAWGNAVLEDLMSELGKASGRDLTEWTTGWLEKAGTDTLVLDRSAGTPTLRAEGPDGGPPRPHRLHIGVYDDADGELTRRETVVVDVDGAATAIPELEQPATLALLNDDDHTFATMRPDEATVSQLLDRAADLPTGMARAVALATLWDMVVTGALPAPAFARCVNVALVRETVEPLVEPLLSHAVAAAERWAPADEVDALLRETADTCLQIIDHGGARKLVALRTLARCATTEAQLDALQSHVGDDIDLQWRTLTRLAALGRFDKAAVAELTDRDPDPDAWVRAMAVEAAQPDADAKQATWDAVMVKHSVPIGSLRSLATAFWQTTQADLLAPFADRYLEILPDLSRLGMIPAMSASGAMFPYVGTGLAFAEQVEAVARSGDVSPVVTGRVLERADQLRRMVAARGQ